MCLYLTKPQPTACYICALVIQHFRVCTKVYNIFYKRSGGDKPAGSKRTPRALIADYVSSVSVSIRIDIINIIF